MTLTIIHDCHPGNDDARRLRRRDGATRAACLHALQCVGVLHTRLEEETP
jgi:hypothetical protein